NLAAREVEQVVGKLTHPRAFFKDHPQQFAALRVRLARILAAQQLGRQRKRGERSPEFVRQSGDQVGAGAILIADVGHVLQNQQRAERLADRMMKRNRLEHVRMIAAANVKIDFGAMAVRPGFLKRAQRIANAQVMRMVAAEIVERTAERVLEIDAQDQRRYQIYMRNNSFRIDQHDAVFEALDDRFGLALFVKEALDVKLVVLLEALGHLVELARDRFELGERLGAKAHLRLALTDPAQPLGELCQRLCEPPSETPRNGGAHQQHQHQTAGEFVGEALAQLYRAAVGAEHGSLVHRDQIVEATVQFGELAIVINARRRGGDAG